MNLKHSCYSGDRDEGVDREALLQDRCDREGFGQEGHGGGRKVKWPNSFFDFIFILLALFSEKFGKKNEDYFFIGIF